jgi:MYXO-CTERM domain-containing protein
MKPLRFAFLLLSPLLGLSSLSAQSIVTDPNDAYVDGTNVVESPGWQVRVGMTDGVNSSTIFAFQLPTLGVGEVFSTASLNVRPFYITQQDFFQTVSTSFNVDLVALNRISTSATILASDFSASASLIESDYVLSSAVSGSDVSNGAGGGVALTAFLNSQYANGANAGSFVFLRLQADTALAGPNDTNNRFEILSRGAGASAEWPRIDYTVTAIPEPSVFAALAGLAALGLAAQRRRRRA